MFFVDCLRLLRKGAPKNVKGEEPDGRETSKTRQASTDEGSVLFRT